MKVAVITGGNRGVGRSAALATAKRGYGIILTYNTNREEADSVVREIIAGGGKALALQLDVSKPSTFGDFAGQVAAHLKAENGSDKIDVLINNAGTAQRKPIRETSEKDVDDLFAVHFKGPFLLAQKLEPLMNEGGQIINISSGLARMPHVGTAVYGAMKAAIETLTKYQAQEFASRKIRVNAVAPGALDTQFGGGRTDEVRKYLSGLTPLGRMGNADDIGQLLALLTSPEAGWVTGQTIGASGGQIL